KPNLLYGQNPDRAVTTHPVFFEGVIRVFQSFGLSLTFGDSPGYGNIASVSKKAGLLSVAEQYKIPLANFEQALVKELPLGTQKVQIPIAEGALLADGMVSLPKMKTHGLTRITGAIKNQLGCVPGFHKAEFHFRFPHIDAFATLLVNLNLLLKPRLYIMDGIVAMEGEGPGGGDPVPMGCILLSADPVALDATFCRLINLNPSFVPTLRLGEALGLGTAQEAAIEFLGDSLEILKRPTFNVKRSPPLQEVTFQGLRPLRNFILPKPRIRRELCQRCGVCVEACPVPEKAIQFTKGKKNPPQYTYSKCIRCFCCHEMCPYKAINIYTPWMGKLLLNLLGR
ncbi:MAG: DUF362 domain-containing protein, partial [Spirochaetales bacterium]